MRQIFVNLPVKDLERSKRMLITEPFFQTFTPRPTATSGRCCTCAQMEK